MGKERFLVTGCAGFIGGHMLERLVGLGHEVIGVDDLSTGDPANMEPVRERFKFIRGSVTDPAVAASVVGGVDRIIHLASVPSVPRSVGNPRESAEASILGTVTLLDAARKAGVKRVVQASSSSVYGDSPVLPRMETAAPSPMSPYAAAKLTQEIYARVFGKCYGLDAVSLRYFNVYGPRQRPEGEYAAVIPKFIAGMLAGKAPEIYGDGEQTRDFTYVDDVVEANLKAALWPEPLRGEAVNIGGGAGRSLNDLVARLNRIFATDLEPRRLPPRQGDVHDSRADIGKAAKLFGYRPKVGFEEGLERTAAFFRAALAGGKI